jgi:hypothetical protein
VIAESGIAERPRQCIGKHVHQGRSER